MASEEKQVSATRKLLDKYDLLAEREKRLIFAAVPFLVLFVIAMLFIEPEYKQAQKLQRQIANQQTQLSALDETQRVLIEQANIDPDEATRIQIQRFVENLNEVEQQFESELGQLVSPQAMPVLLQELFNNAESLSLIKLESIPPVPVFSELNSSTTLYQHGINIEFEGSYVSTLEFLQSAENIGWKLYWKELEYSVDEYPTATTRLEVFTLSTSQAFIGVN